MHFRSGEVRTLQKCSLRTQNSSRYVSALNAPNWCFFRSRCISVFLSSTMIVLRISLWVYDLNLFACDVCLRFRSQKCFCTVYQTRVVTLKIPDSESRLSTETFHHHPNKPLKEVEDEGSIFGFAPFQNLTLTEFQSHEFRPCTPGEEKEAQKQLHEALDPEIYQIKHRKKSIQRNTWNGFTGSPHCLRVWTFQDHIFWSITRVILAINAFKNRFISIRHW